MNLNFYSYTDRSQSHAITETIAVSTIIASTVSMIIASTVLQYHVFAVALRLIIKTELEMIEFFLVQDWRGVAIESGVGLFL
jgi:hypothetical protein